MRKNMLIIAAVAALALAGNFPARPSVWAEDTLSVGSVTGGQAGPDDRVKALEAQMEELRDQSRQLTEQNRQLLELMQKMVEDKTKEPASAAKPELSATPAQTEPPAVKALSAPKDQYAPGWLARIISVPKDFNITDSLPPLEVGNFVATKSGYQLYEYMDLVNGAPLVQYPLWKAEAFLLAEDAGNYVFSVSSSPTNSKYYRGPPLRGIYSAKAIYVEGIQVAAGSDETIMGGTELEPGLYRVEFRVCHDVLKSRISGRLPDLNFNIQVKRPSDSQLQPISQTLLLPVPKGARK